MSNSDYNRIAAAIAAKPILIVRPPDDPTQPCSAGLLTEPELVALELSDDYVAGRQAIVHLGKGLESLARHAGREDRPFTARDMLVVGGHPSPTANEVAMIELTSDDGQFTFLDLFGSMLIGGLARSGVDRATSQLAANHVRNRILNDTIDTIPTYN